MIFLFLILFTAVCGKNGDVEKLFEDVDKVIDSCVEENCLTMECCEQFLPLDFKKDGVAMGVFFNRWSYRYYVSGDV